MGEIKFRGKQIDNGRWVYGYFFKTPLTSEVMNTEPKDGWSFLCGKERYCIAQDNCVFEVYPETIGQYTGLKDKNGKEIYEGDILTSTEYPFQDNGVYNYHAEVIYFENCPSFGYIEHCVNPNKSGINEGMGESFEDNEQGDMFEIIGNIYENPELLKCKDNV